jgi:hypothetical protein
MESPQEQQIEKFNGAAEEQTIKRTQCAQAEDITGIRRTEENQKYRV